MRMTGIPSYAHSARMLLLSKTNRLSQQTDIWRLKISGNECDLKPDGLDNDYRWKEAKKCKFLACAVCGGPWALRFYFCKKKSKNIFSLLAIIIRRLIAFSPLCRRFLHFFFQPKKFNIFCAFRGRDRETWTPRIIREPHNYAPRKKQNNAVPTVRSEIGEGNAHWASLVAFVTSVKAFKFGARETSRDFWNSISIQWNIGSQRSLLSKVESSVLISLIKISFRYANEQGCGTGFQRDLLVSKLKKWKLRK